MKWNSDRPLNFIGADLLRSEVRDDFGISIHEQVEERVDRDFWRINWVRGSVTAQLPWKWKGDKIAKELGVIYEKLEEAIGGKVKRTWPVIHLLATRKWIHQLRHKTATRFNLPSVDRFCQYPRFSFAVCTPNPSTHLHQPSPSTRHQPSPPQGSQIGLFPSTTTIGVIV